MDCALGDTIFGAIVAAIPHLRGYQIKLAPEIADIKTYICFLGRDC